MSKDKIIKRKPSDLMVWERNAIISKIASVVDLSDFFSGEDLERVQLLINSCENRVDLFKEIKLNKILPHKSSINYGDVMSVDNFLESCQDDWITDDDGSCDFIDVDGYIITDQKGYIPYIRNKKKIDEWKTNNPNVKEVLFYGK